MLFSLIYLPKNLTDEASSQHGKKNRGRGQLLATAPYFTIVSGCEES